MTQGLGTYTSGNVVSAHLNVNRVAFSEALPSEFQRAIGVGIKHFEVAYPLSREERAGHGAVESAIVKQAYEMWECQN